ncbi:hypothetical protein PV08_11059 [Exophiala spinifera]|uniref:Cytochrome P450 n=1 Tax=Exophiala spinifera TaxID=91928 RepID=A0A0D2BFI1_9EURO|nr:uncharacterized protein PV08_11059 [Exophiala spinifera]KIW10099.1 hypothetical protein PV08_11059 [Exophiala spinifera]
MNTETKLLIMGVVLLLVLVRVLSAIRASSNGPLNKIPGPTIARWTNLRLKWAIITGQRIFYVHELHQRYGPFVRISPTEIAVSDVESFTQIHRIGSGFHKSRWYLDLVDFPRPTLFSMNDPAAHAARRRLLARGFSKSSLRQRWESVVNDRILLTMRKIGEESTAEGHADVLKWFTFMATDISSHLMFGNSQDMVNLGKAGDFLSSFTPERG